jgi:predicted nucleic acid-binding protein
VTFLLDTNILSEVAKPRPSERVVAWLSTLSRFAISAVTVEEVFFGLTLKPKPRLQERIENLLAAFSHVYEVTEPIARHAGILRGELGRRGRVRDQTDMLIAATASAHGLTLATRNKRDFDGCGIAVFDPFV